MSNPCLCRYCLTASSHVAGGGCAALAVRLPRRSFCAVRPGPPVGGLQGGSCSCSCSMGLLYIPVCVRVANNPCSSDEQPLFVSRTTLVRVAHCSSGELFTWRTTRVYSVVVNPLPLCRWERTMYPRLSSFFSDAQTVVFPNRVVLISPCMLGKHVPDLLRTGSPSSRSYCANRHRAAQTAISIPVSSGASMSGTIAYPATLSTSSQPQTARLTAHTPPAPAGS